MILCAVGYLREAGPSLIGENIACCACFAGILLCFINFTLGNCLVCPFSTLVIIDIIPSIAFKAVCTESRTVIF